MITEDLSLLIQRYLYEDAPVLYLHIDPHSKVKDANRFAQERMESDPRGKELHTLFLSMAAPLELSFLRKQADQIHLLHMETPIGLPETFRVRVMLFGDETLLLGSLDADETGRLRKELISLNNRLNTLTRELQKKNHELDELNQLKSRFLGMAAHDLRKPVGAVLNYAEFLIDEIGSTLNETHLGFLKTIRASTDLMRGVIDDFLDISMIESGRLRLELTLLQMRVPVEKTAALYHRKAFQKGVALRVVCNESVPAVKMDGVKIEQVLNNLVSNAIEHAPPESEVVIRVAPADQGVKVTVSDGGPGIGEEEKKKLFQPFVQGASPKTGGAKRMGLGLAISKKIIEAHGGTLWIEDNLNQGAAFSFFLPLTPVQKENTP